MKKIISYIIIIAFSFSALWVMGGFKKILIFRPIAAVNVYQSVTPVLTEDKQAEATPLVVNIVDRTPPIVSDCAEDEKTVRYNLSDCERDVIERVVMAEAGGESYEGMMLVAQCILNAVEITDTPPSKAVVTYKYTKSRPEPSDKVRQAVAAVFDLGETVTDEPVLYFYNPAKCKSEWHESQDFGIEEGNHRFFKEN